jgi:SAM-dependent methyltransferase
MRGLNLGCGRIQFPVAPDAPYIWHLRKYLNEYCPTAHDFDAEWINADRNQIDGVDVQVDLFTYPWILDGDRPARDNSFDVIWASHIIEHIPHRAEYNQYADYNLKRAGSVDGWYAFFYEVWRLLKPDGIVHLVCPSAFSASAVADPSHCRYILPESFSYFRPNLSDPFDYGIGYAFDAINNAEVRLVKEAEEKYKEYDDMYLAYLNAEGEQKKELYAITKQKNQEMIKYMNRHINCIEELYLAMKPVK